MNFTVKDFNHPLFSSICSTLLTLLTLLLQDRCMLYNLQTLVCEVKSIFKLPAVSKYVFSQISTVSHRHYQLCIKYDFLILGRKCSGVDLRFVNFILHCILICQSLLFSLFKVFWYLLLELEAVLFDDWRCWLLIDPLEEISLIRGHCNRKIVVIRCTLKLVSLNYYSSEVLLHHFTQFCIVYYGTNIIIIMKWHLLRDWTIILSCWPSTGVSIS